MKIERQFDDILNMITVAREKAMLAVNTELIELYWSIGQYISKKVNSSYWGKGIVNNLSEYIYRKVPDIKGFSPQNLWRMKQFFDTYSKNKKLSSLLRELSWTNNLMIISKATSEK